MFRFSIKQQFAALTLTLLVSSVFGIDLDAKIGLDIRPQPLATALIEFSKQAKVQVMSSGVDLAKKKSPGINGEHSIEEALKALLSGTGLQFSFTGPNTVTVTARPAGGAGPRAAVSAEEMRLARVEVAGDSAPKNSADGEADAAQVVVEGQRDRPAPFSTANLDLTRTENDTLPFTVFTAKDIALSGASDLQNFLQNWLPQNFSTNTGEADGSGYPTLSGRVDLRGWGEMETVFLLNGRRMPAHYQRELDDAYNATPNLRGIPLNSIERIEILSSAGSAIYGDGATGGVINIITRQDFHGGELAVNYETPADVHVPRRSVNLSYGLPWKGGLGLRLGAGYTDSKPMRVGDRADITIERWRRLAMERQPTRLINLSGGNPAITGSSVFGATPNIHASTTSASSPLVDLFADIPGIQGYTTVPAGSTGNSPLSAYEPLVFNLELAEGSAGVSNYARDSTYGSPNRNMTLSFGLDKSFGPEWRWSAEYRYTQSDVEGHSGGGRQFTTPNPYTSSPRVPAEAPTNPFGVPVWVILIDPNLVRPELINRSRNATWDFSSTLRGALGEWRGFIDLSYSHNRNRYVLQNFREPTGGWTEAFLSGRYNPFVDPRVIAPGVDGFYEDYIAERRFYASATRTYQSSIKASGPLLKLPAGALQLTGGIEGSRTERYHTELFAQYQDGVTGAPAIPAGGTSDIYSKNAYSERRFSYDRYAAYAEAILPLVAAAHTVPLVHTLELFGSGRLDRTVKDGYRAQSAQEQQDGVPPERSAIPTPHI